MPAQPLPEEIVACLASRAAVLGAFARHPQYHACVSSTNDVAARLADAGAPEGTWVIADAQTAGRGRRGRTWLSPEGAGLYLSVIFRPPTTGSASAVRHDDRATPLLTLMAGVAVANGVRAATGLAPTLKWPNDVVIEPGRRTAPGRFRKLAGILAEASATGGELESVIVGIGVNLTPAAYPPDVAARATSIEGELGRPVDRALVLVEVLCALAEGRRMLLDGRQPELLRAWRALAPSSIGRRVRWMVGDRQTSGITEGIDERGALLVRTDAHVEHMIAGDLQWD
jgi:BirA family transcriptional regulator, biotin operon repressor / biotin---[acetyl-CoA-carboxylase] ligase